MDANQIKALPRWGTTRWIYPISRMLKVDLRDVLRELIPNESEYNATFHNHEYRIGLIQHQNRDEPDAYRAASGEFVGERQWTRDGVPLAEIAFQKMAARADPHWPWKRVVGSKEDYVVRLAAYREVLKEYKHW